MQTLISILFCCGLILVLASISAPTATGIVLVAITGMVFIVQAVMMFKLAEAKVQ